MASVRGSSCINKGGGGRGGGVSQLVPFSSDAGLESRVAAKIRDCQALAVEEAASLAAAVPLSLSLSLSPSLSLSISVHLCLCTPMSMYT